ncbi:hypothetical protein GA0070624_4585 [Micromonospora rhizosphaerae]|uniref:Uncharacterized protein n=1 Tax=Micromonospora rhizosphaerae TaxID=568872 RepID=A0A1C6ST84_9ACTN|nr:hypothetical protein [Micromonospora rhizosphaerae]SCL32854.1 hypothetical protein GA0070624_4585 [Micromonospora rhizosphaerae]
MSVQPDHRARLTGGLLLWYGVLGGALAWAVHLFVGWSLDELTCATGADTVAQVPLWQAVWLAVVVPAVATVGALLVATLAWRRTARAQRGREDDPSFGRARMLAVVGIWANLLFLAIIVLGGVAVLVLPPCQR